MNELALLSYAAVMSVTPGPNNLMLAASGVNFGFRRTVPHILGIWIGVSVQLFLVAVGIGFALQWFQTVRKILAVAGCLYLLWLSWKIAKAGNPDSVTEMKPLGFFGAAFFQVLNPKAWVMVINSSLLFLAKELPLAQAAALLSLSFSLANLPCIVLWAFAGDRLRLLLSKEKARLTFNITMAVLMGLTALWLLAEELLTS